MAPEPLAAAYTRVSSQEQAQGHSLESQYDEIRAYAKNRGYRVRWTFSDVESGMELHRPHFQRMLGMADGKRFQVILVWRRDRFGRDPIHNGIVEAALRTVGVRIEAVATGPQDDNEETEFRNGLDDLMARREARLIFKRTHGGRRTGTAKGLWTRGGPDPFGYRRNPLTKRLEPHHPEASIVQRALQAVAAGEPVQRVSHNNGVERRRVQGWLQNPVYVGDTQYDGILTRDTHQALVTRELQAAALAANLKWCQSLGKPQHKARRKPIESR